MTSIHAAQLKARRLGYTIRRSAGGDFRVNKVGGAEASAYYTDDIDDALATAKVMAAREQADAEAEADDAAALKEVKHATALATRLAASLRSIATATYHGGHPEHDEAWRGLAAAMLAAKRAAKEVA